MFWQSAIDWFTQQSERDQKILKFGSLSLLVIVFYLLILQPLTQGRVQLRKQVETAQQDLIYIKQGAARIANSGSASSGTNAQSTNQVVNSTARKHGITVTRMSPKKDNTQLGLWLDEVEFSKLLTWVDEIQNKGLSIESIDINQSSNLGLVKATLTVSRGSAK